MPGSILVFRDKFIRHRPVKLTSVGKPSEMFLGIHNRQKHVERDKPFCPYFMEIGGLQEHGISFQEVYPNSFTYEEGVYGDIISEFIPNSNLHGVLYFVCNDSMKFAVVLKTNGKIAYGHYIRM